MKPLLIIPCFNDNNHLNTLMERTSFQNTPVDTLIVDDGSREVVSVKSNHNSIGLIRNVKNRGKGYSIKRGMSYALKNKYTHVITLDADLQHDPIYIDRFLNISKEVDIVIGARNFDSSMPFLRRFSNFTTSFILSLLTKKKILDSQSGYRRYKIDSVYFDHCAESGFQFESEVLINKLRDKNATLGHIPISTIYNDEKSSINNLSDTYKFIKLIVKKIFVR